ncbi:MAG: hypothetical protein IT169_10345 [Bryobacterales bacterium]|nr:hypothetical protein [Bryobacterales bacterium]
MARKMQFDDPQYEITASASCAKPENRISRLPRGRKGYLAGAILVFGAFAAGLWLGHHPASPHPSSSSSSASVAGLFAGPDRGSSRLETPGSRLETPEPATKSNPQSRILRVRATSRVSSGNARTGESVLFLTEHAMQTHSGEHVPAGSLVEGVIARARPSSTRNPGSLVIEIRALHVGNQSIPLHALPYTPRNPIGDEAAPPEKTPNVIDIRALGIRNQLRPNPEIVMPKESVIEFELVEADSAETPLRDIPVPVSPLPSLQLPSNPSEPRPSLRAPAPEATPPAPLRRPRVITERG